MAIEAPYSKYRKQNCIIFIVVVLALSGWCIYDGYMNDKWIAEHTNEDGTPQAYLVFNRQAPFYMIPLSVVIAVFWFIVRDKKLIADENALVFSENEKIPYDSIQAIDKTHYEAKGYFIITYKTDEGPEQDKKISYKKYDNTKAILEYLVEKITHTEQA